LTAIAIAGENAGDPVAIGFQCTHTGVVVKFDPAGGGHFGEPLREKPGIAGLVVFRVGGAEQSSA
jgi:hypothetical protein